MLKINEKYNIFFKFSKRIDIYIYCIVINITYCTDYSVHSIFNSNGLKI